MAGSKSGGFTLEFQKSSYENLNKQMDNLKKVAPELGFKMLVKLLFDIKYLAQNKLRSDKHIITSRLRNSIYVQTPAQKYANRGDNADSYSDRKGKSYSRTLDVELSGMEGAVGTNVEYANAIEFGYPAQTINAKPGGVLTWMPEAEGEAWFTGKKMSSLKKYYKTSTGENTFKRSRIFVKSIRHPGFAGDSFLYWAMKHVDVKKRARELSKTLLPDIHKGRTNEEL